MAPDTNSRTKKTPGGIDGSCIEGLLLPTQIPRTKKTPGGIDGGWVEGIRDHWPLTRMNKENKKSKVPKRILQTKVFSYIMSNSSFVSASPLRVPGFALVTGAGSGIGRAISLLLAREGCAGIVLADFNPKSAASVQKEVSEVATNPEFRAVDILTDVGDEASVKVMVNLAVETFGRLDYAVNCAGIGFKKAIGDTELPDWDRIMSTNLTGVFLSMREELRVMQQQTPRQNG